MALKPRGTILVEVLIVIAIAAIVTTLSAQTIYVSMVGTKSSSNRETAAALLMETFESVDNIASERWQNIFDLNKDGSPYYPSASGGSWRVLPGSEQVAVGEEIYTRSFIVQNICREDATKAITGVTDGSGSAVTCAGTGGVFDPSTEKITVTVTVPDGDPHIENSYITRWRNKVCVQTLWSGSGSIGVKICPDTTYETRTNMTTGNSLELCSGGC